MEALVVLVTDRVYAKTSRHIQKVKACLNEGSLLCLACVDGFPKGLTLV